ncbi:MAG: hypothetical protein V3V61_02050 [Gammaproteobacteria bacterium]
MKQLHRYWPGLIGLGLIMNISACAAEADVADNLKAHIEELASDKYGGRAPLTGGDLLTTNYLAEQFEALGLAPGWQGSYLQPVPLAKVTPLETELKVGEDLLEQNDDYVIVSKLRESNVELNDSELIFIGYGIVVREDDNYDGGWNNWNDYENTGDLNGKTVVMLVNDPGFATQNPELLKVTL